MSGFPILDLVVGMIFIYFLLSIISSSLVEIVLSSFKIRSKVLSKWLLAIFDKKMMQPDGTTLQLGQSIMDHCTTTALAKAGKATSFMDAKNFVSSLLEKVTFDAEQPGVIAENLEQVIANIKKSTALNGTSLLSTELQRAFLMYAFEAKEAYKASLLTAQSGVPVVSELQLFREKLENWFDMSMDRIQGHMKLKYARPITLVVAIVVVLGLNADSVAIAKFLYTNPEARAKIAAQAYVTAQDTLIQKKIDSLAGRPETKDVAADLKENHRQLKEGIATLKETGIPLGWDDTKNKNGTMFTRLGGWIASILAIMMGAPFWFDLLNKISNMRGAGTKPSSTTDIKSKK